MAVEMLIFSTESKRIGCFDSRYTLPFIATSAMAAEVYFNSDLGITWLLVRSQLRKDSAPHFAEELCEWIHTSNFSRVVMLSSADAMKKDDESIQTQNPFCSFSSRRNTEQLEHKAQLCQFRDLGDVTPDQIRDMSQEHAAPAGAEDEDVLIAPRSSTSRLLQRVDGGEFARQMHRVCKANGIPMMVLICYVSEGDNRGDARNFAGRSLDFLVSADCAHSCQLMEPPVWNAVFGDPLEDSSLFL